MLWICADDGVAFSVDAPRCPQCGGTRYRPQGEEDGPICVIGEAGELAAEPGPVDLLGGGLPPLGDEVELDTTPAPTSTGRKK